MRPKQALVKLKVVQKEVEKAQGKNNEAKKNEKIEAKLHEINASVLAMGDSIATQMAAPEPAEP